MADEPREFIPKDDAPGERMLVFDLASRDGDPASPPPPPPAEAPLPLSREPRRRASRKGLLFGLAGAVALGATLGLVARPELIGEPQKMQPARPPAEAPAIAVPQMQVMVQDAPEAELVEPSAPETDLGADATAAAAAAPDRATPPAGRPPPPSAAPPAQIATAPARPEPAPRADAPVREPPVVARVEPRPPRTRPSFDCRYAGSLSEEMVCADPQLAAADRRLAQAYDRAVAAGVPRRYLRAEQDDWLAIREQAARRSPGAVADIYEQRTAELNDMAIEAQDGF